MRIRLTRQADKDIESILDQTLLQFGPAQVERYSAIVSRGLDMIAENPGRSSARARPEIAPDVRAFHLSLAAKRSGGASHLLYFRTQGDGLSQEVVVLRVLHDRMEPRRRLLSAILQDETP